MKNSINDTNDTAKTNLRFIIRKFLNNECLFSKLNSKIPARYEIRNKKTYIRMKFPFLEIKNSNALIRLESGPELFIKKYNRTESAIRMKYTAS